MNLKNQFLLAMPTLTGDYFAGTLTYVCEHSDEGAMGLMINRPLSLSLVELFAQLGLRANRRWVDTTVLEGGPVATERGFVLHSADRTFATSADLGDGLYLSTALEVLDAIADDDGPRDFLVALGYAGWGAGQLEDEIASNIWLTTPADADIIFQTPSDERFDRAGKLLGIDVNLISPKAGHA
jgi:putative transcriptional regulator